MSLDKFETRIKNQLDDNVERLDDATKTRLRTIRREALNQPAKVPWFFMPQLRQGWMPATALACCGIIAVMLFLPSETTQNNGSMPLEQMAVLELMENPESVDVLSDPGFYMWLDEIEGDTGNG